MLKYDIIAEHEEIRAKMSSPETLEYIENFYYEKIVRGDLSLRTVLYSKLPELPFDDSIIDHIARHIEYMLGHRALKEVTPQPPIRLDLDYKRRQQLALYRVKNRLTQKEQYSPRRAFIRDKTGRIHHINPRTGKFVPIPKHLRRKRR